ncbi:hypothetical protein QE152_g13519 [Popillia japonica]|uniref:Uncharacterized protein n=1 Tax=Popillia japonica TaxID=7064 RepID=A0AAW1LDM1_POPJA
MKRKLKQKEGNQKKKVTKQIFDSDSEGEVNYFQDVEEDDEDDASCIYCMKLYSISRSGELWIRCQKKNVPFFKNVISL